MDGIPPDAPKAVLDAAGFKRPKKLECLTAEDVKGGIMKMLAREMATKTPAHSPTSGVSATI